MSEQAFQVNKQGVGTMTPRGAAQYILAFVYHSGFLVVRQDDGVRMHVRPREAPS